MRVASSAGVGASISDGHQQFGGGTVHQERVAVPYQHNQPGKSRINCRAISSYMSRASHPRIYLGTAHKPGASQISSEGS